MDRKRNTRAQMRAAVRWNFAVIFYGVVVLLTSASGSPKLYCRVTGNTAWIPQRLFYQHQPGAGSDFLLQVACFDTGSVCQQPMMQFILEIEEGGQRTNFTGQDLFPYNITLGDDDEYTGSMRLIKNEVLLSELTVTYEIPACNDWQYYWKLGSLYYHDDSRKKWNNAKESCDDAHDAHLVVIADAEENDFLHAFLQRCNAGLVYTAGKYSGGQWEWENTGSHFSYDNWLSGEPDEECMCMDDSGKWRSCHCSNRHEKRQFVCEKEQSGVLTAVLEVPETVFQAPYLTALLRVTFVPDTNDGSSPIYSKGMSSQAIESSGTEVTCSSEYDYDGVTLYAVSDHVTSNNRMTLTHQLQLSHQQGTGQMSHSVRLYCSCSSCDYSMHYFFTNTVSLETLDETLKIEPSAYTIIEGSTFTLAISMLSGNAYACVAHINVNDAINDTAIAFNDNTNTDITLEMELVGPVPITARATCTGETHVHTRNIEIEVTPISIGNLNLETSQLPGLLNETMSFELITDRSDLPDGITCTLAITYSSSDADVVIQYSETRLNTFSTLEYTTFNNISLGNSRRNFTAVAECNRLGAHSQTSLTFLMIKPITGVVLSASTNRAVAGAVVQFSYTVDLGIVAEFRLSLENPLLPDWLNISRYANVQMDLPGSYTPILQVETERESKTYSLTPESLEILDETKIIFDVNSNQNHHSTIWVWIDWTYTCDVLATRFPGIDASTLQTKGLHVAIREMNHTIGEIQEVLACMHIATSDPQAFTVGGIYLETNQSYDMPAYVARDRFTIKLPFRMTLPVVPPGEQTEHWCLNDNSANVDASTASYDTSTASMNGTDTVTGNDESDAIGIRTSEAVSNGTDEYGMCLQVPSAAEVNFIFEVAFHVLGVYDIEVTQSDGMACPLNSMRTVVLDILPNMSLLLEVPPIVLFPPGSVQFSLNKTNTSESHAELVQMEVRTSLSSCCQTAAPIEHSRFPSDWPYNFTYILNAEQTDMDLILDIWNPIHSMSLRTPMEIATNDVRLLSLTEDGPQYVNKPLNWTLDMSSFGYDSCILWMIEKEGFNFTVLMERPDRMLRNCTHLYRGLYDEYAMIQEDEDNFTVLSWSGDIYGQPGIYTTIIEASNGFSSDRISQKTLITDVLCYRPNLNVGILGHSPDNPRQIHWSEEFSLLVVIESNCLLEVEYRTLWEVHRLGENQSVVLESQSGIMFTYRPKMLEKGMYVLNITNTMLNLEMDIFTYKCVYIEVTSTPLKVKIQGFEEQIYDGSEEIVLTTFSLDPDLIDPGDLSDMVWKWQCSRDALVSFSGESEWNDVDCGATRPTDISSGTIRFGQNSFEPDNKYFITVELSKGHRTAEATHILHINDGEVHEVELDCRQNCLERVDILSSLVLQAECLSCDPSVIAKWSLDRYDNTTGQYVTSHNSTELDIFQAGTKTNIRLRPGELQGDSKYLVRIQFCLANDVLIAQSAMSIRTSDEPRGGSCRSLVNYGVVYYTVYGFVCEGWRDIDTTIKDHSAAPLHYELYAAIRALPDSFQYVLLRRSRLPEMRHVLLPIGDPATNYTLELYIKIIDRYGAFVKEYLNTTVSPPSGNDSSNHLVLPLLTDINNYTVAEDVTQLVTSSWIVLSLIDDNKIGRRLAVESDLPLLADISCVDNSDLSPECYIAGMISTVYGLSASTRRQRRSTSTLSNSSASTADVTEVKQIAELLRVLVERDVDYVIPGPITVNASDQVNHLVMRITQLEEKISPETLDILVNNTMYIISYVTDKRHMDKIGDVTEEHPGINYTFGEVEQSIRHLSDLISRDALPGQRYSVEARNMTLLGGMEDLADLAAEGFNSSDICGDVAIPAVAFQRNNSAPIILQHTVWSKFMNGPPSSLNNNTGIDLNQPIIQVFFKDANTSEAFVLYRLQEDYNMTINIMRYEVDENSTEYGTINDTSRDIVITGVTKESNFSRVLINIGTELDVANIQIWFSDNPYPKDDQSNNVFHETITIADNLESSIPGSTSANFTVLHLFVPSIYTPHPGVYYAAAMIQGSTDGAIALTATFYLSVVEERCILWNAVALEWDDSICQVDDSRSTQAKVVFHSKVFPSSFGAGLLVLPNTIKFDKVFDDALLKFLDTIFVTATVAFFLILYFAILPFACRKDRRDMLNWMPLPVSGYWFSAPYLYTIDVYTGYHRFAGTKSTVYVILVGDKGESPSIKLSTKDRTNFKRGDMNRFSVRSPFSLGKIRYVRVYHDHTGEGRYCDWYLEKMTIKDWANNKKFLFICEKWIGFDRDGQYDQPLPLATLYDMEQNESMGRRARNLAFENNLWMSTFMRREEDYFTRAQRITCAVTIIFLYMIADCMWYEREDKDGAQDGIQIGPVSFTLQWLVISFYSLMTVLPASLLIVLLFSASKPRHTACDAQFKREKAAVIHKLKDMKERFGKADLGKMFETNRTTGSTRPIVRDDDSTYYDPVYGAKRKNSYHGGFCRHLFTGEIKVLPFWCRYVGMVMCAGAIVASGFFTILYGMQWGKEKAFDWLISFLFSFLEAEGIVSPMKILIMALLIAVLCKHTNDITDYYDDDDFEDYVFTESLNDEETRLRKERLRKKQKLKAQLKQGVREFLWHALFMVCLVSVMVGNRDPKAFLCNEIIKSDLQGYADVTDKAAFWDYIRTVAIPQAYKTSLYNGNPVAEKDLAFIDNHYFLRLGSPSLRQFRVKHESCEYGLHILEMRVKRCVKDYNNAEKFYDDGTYLPGWIPIQNESRGIDSSSALQRAYTYDDGEPTGYDYAAQYTMYYGRGYNIPLGMRKEEATERVDQLIETRWLDAYSRAVVFEMNAYNAFVNKFTLFTVVFEFPSTGGALARETTRTLTLYRYIGGWGLLNLLAEVIVILFTVVLTIRYVVNSFKEGKAFMCNVWSFMEVFKIACALGAIALYVLRTLMIKDTVEEMKNNKESLVVFKQVVLVDEIFCNLIGLCLFVQILQIMWVFKFNRTLGQLGVTLRYSFGLICTMSVISSVVFLAYAILMYIQLGSHIENYRSFLDTCYSQMNAIMGKFVADNIEMSSGWLGKIIFLSYMIVMLFIYVNMFVSILTDVYMDVTCGRLKPEDSHMAMDLVAARLESTFRK